MYNLHTAHSAGIREVVAWYQSRRHRSPYLVPFRPKSPLSQDSDFALSSDLIRHVSRTLLFRWSMLSNHEDPIRNRSKVFGSVNTMVLPEIKGAPRYKITSFAIILAMQELRVAKETFNTEDVHGLLDCRNFFVFEIK